MTSTRLRLVSLATQWDVEKKIIHAQFLGDWAKKKKKKKFNFFFLGKKKALSRRFVGDAHADEKQDLFFLALCFKKNQLIDSQ